MEREKEGVLSYHYSSQYDTLLLRNEQSPRLDQADLPTHGQKRHFSQQIVATLLACERLLVVSSQMSLQLEACVKDLQANRADQMDIWVSNLVYWCTRNPTVPEYGQDIVAVW